MTDYQITVTGEERSGLMWTARGYRDAGDDVERAIADAYEQEIERVVGGGGSIGPLPNGTTIAVQVLPAVDPDVARLAKGLDLADGDDRAIFRQRVALIYRNAKRINARQIADEAIQVLS